MKGQQTLPIDASRIDTSSSPERRRHKLKTAPESYGRTLSCVLTCDDKLLYFSNSKRKSVVGSLFGLVAESIAKRFLERQCFVFDEFLEYPVLDSPKQSGHRRRTLQRPIG